MPESTRLDHTDPEGKGVAGMAVLLLRILAAATLGAYAAAALKFLVQNASAFMAAERWALDKLGTAVREPEAGLPAIAVALIVACIICAIVVLLEMKFQLLKQVALNVKALQATCNWSGGFWSKLYCVLIAVVVAIIVVITIIITVLVAVVVFLNLKVIFG